MADRIISSWADGAQMHISANYIEVHPKHVYKASRRFQTTQSDQPSQSAQH